MAALEDEPYPGELTTIIERVADSPERDENSKIDKKKRNKNEIIYLERVHARLAHCRHQQVDVAVSMFTRQNWNALKYTTMLLLQRYQIPGWYLTRNIFVDFHTAKSLSNSDLKEFLNNFLVLTEGNRYNVVLEFIMLILTKQEMLFQMKPFIPTLKRRIEKSNTLRAALQAKDMTPGFIILDEILILYEAYLEYLDWDDLRQSSQEFSEKSQLDSADRIRRKLMRVLEHDFSEEVNIDIIPLCLIDLFETQEQISDMRKMLEYYSDKLPDHLNAQLYFYEFLNKYHPYRRDTLASRMKTLKKLVNICPESRYALRLASHPSEQSDLDICERIRMVVDFIDFVKNRSSRKGWNMLAKIMTEITELTDDEKARSVEMFKFRLQFWKVLHFRHEEINALRSQIAQYKKAAPPVQSESETAFSSATVACDDDDDDELVGLLGNRNRTRNLPGLSKTQFDVIRSKVRFLEAYRHHFEPLRPHYTKYLDLVKYA